MKKILLTLFLALMLPCIMVAQTGVKENEAVKIYFRQGKSTLDRSYKGNGSNLAKLAELLKQYTNDNEKEQGRILIRVSASPEGAAGVNERLIDARARKITNWINKELGTSIGYEIVFFGIDWSSLATLVQESQDVPAREELLKIITAHPATYETDTRQSQIEALQGGAPYRWLLDNLYPELRYASVGTEVVYDLKIVILSPKHMKFGAEGGEGVVEYRKNIKSNRKPVVTVDREWVKALEPQDSSVVFAVAPNPSTEPRQASMVLDYYGRKQLVRIEQEGADPYLNITSAVPVNMPAAGGSDTVRFVTNAPENYAPGARSNAKWITNVVSTHDGITYDVAPNDERGKRSGELLVESFGKVDTVTVNQKSICSRPFYMSVKNNMLFDLATVPNIGVEFYIARNWTVAANWHYAWWRGDTKHIYWRTYGGDMSVRKYFGKAAKEKPLTGHHLGVYGQMITYDFELGGRGYLADRWSWAAGLEYGYSLPVARRLNIEFTLGAGYHWGKYAEYLPIDGHYVWQSTKRRRYIGPTKCEISLVWLLGCGNWNKEKGGKR